MKACSKCGEEKPFSEFYRHRRGDRPESDPLAYYAACKVCRREPRSDWVRKREAKKHLKYKRKYDSAGEWRKQLRRHHVTVGWYEEKLAEQNNGCAICGVTEDEIGRHFSVDHDHSCCLGGYSCGKCVRGLLCNKCNVGIGFFGDSVDRMYAAAKYMDRWRVS